MEVRQTCRHTRSKVPSDDAASSPHQGDRTVVQRPAELFSGLSQQHESLRVGDDLGSIEGLDRESKPVYTSVSSSLNLKANEVKCVSITSDADYNCDFWG